MVLLPVPFPKTQVAGKDAGSGLVDQLSIIGIHSYFQWHLLIIAGPIGNSVWQLKRYFVLLELATNFKIKLVRK